MSTGFSTTKEQSNSTSTEHTKYRHNIAHEGATQRSPRRSNAIQPTREQYNTAHEGATQYSPRRSNAIQTMREQYNAAHEGATQHSPRRSTTKTGYTPDCLKTKINQQEPLGFGRAELKARRREEDWIEIGGKSTYIRPMHGEEAATTTHKLLPMSGSVYKVPYYCNGQHNYGMKFPIDHPSTLTCVITNIINVNFNHKNNISLQYV